MSNEKLNGSVDLLATAMRDVFVECMDSNRMAMKEDLSVVERPVTDSDALVVLQTDLNRG